MGLGGSDDDLAAVYICWPSEMDWCVRDEGWQWVAGARMGYTDPDNP